MSCTVPWHFQIVSICFQCYIKPSFRKQFIFTCLSFTQESTTLTKMFSKIKLNEILPHASLTWIRMLKETWTSTKSVSISWREKCPNTDFFSGPYFSVFGLNTEKYGPQKTSYLDTFHAVFGTLECHVLNLIKDK